MVIGAKAAAVIASTAGGDGKGLPEVFAGNALPVNGGPVHVDLFLEPGRKKNSALGVKEAQILEAEGQAEAIKRVADADKYQKLTVAEGEGQAIERVFGAIHTGDPTPDLIAIRYLEALQGIADGQASKVFLPVEMSGIMASIGAIGELFSGEGATGEGQPERTAVRRPVPPAEGTEF